jgi:hypothetical protein
MVRITSFEGMTPIDIMIQLSDGNPGGATALAEMYGSTAEVDPQNMLGGLGAILQFDTYGIYGSDIYILWSDQCNRDTRRLHVLMRATQLGIFDRERLKELAGDQMRTNVISEEEFELLDHQVCAELVDFMRPVDQAA